MPKPRVILLFILLSIAPAHADLTEAGQAFESGDARDAIRSANIALSNARARNNAAEEQTALERLATYVLADGRATEALTYVRDALAIAHRRGDNEAEARQTLLEGRIHLGLNDWSAAERAFTRLLENAAGREATLQEATAREGIGMARMGQNRTGEAIDELERADILYQRVRATERAATVENLLAPLYVATGRIDRAAELLHRRINAAAASRDQSAQARAWVELARAYSAAGQPDSAIGAYRRALAIEQARPAWAPASRILLEMAAEYLRMENRDLAFQVLENARRAAVNAAAPALEIQAMIGQAEIETRMGRRREALATVNEALKRAEAGGPENLELEALLLKGKLLAETGDRHEANRIFVAARAMAGRLKNVEREADALEAQAGIFRSLNSPDEAEEAMATARRLRQPADSETAPVPRENPAAVALREGDELLAAGRAEEASARFEFAATEFARSLFRYGEAIAKYKLGLARLTARELVKARECLSEVLHLAQSLGDRDLEYRALLLLAGIDLSEDRRELALQRYERTLEILDGLRYAAPPGEVRQSFFVAHMRTFAEMIDLLLAEGLVERAFELTERMRARGLIEMIVESEADIWRSLPADAGTETRPAEEKKNREDRLVTLRHSLLAALRDGKTAEYERLSAELTRDEEEYARFLERMRRLAPALERTAYPDAVTAREVVDLLEPDEIFVSYWLSGSTAGVFVLSEEGCRFRPLTVSSAELDRLVLDLLAPWRAGGRDYHKTGGVAAHRARSATLARLLLEPVKAAASGRARRWIIVPDGALKILPFEALLIETAPLRYLIDEEIDLTYAPSVTVAAKLISRARPRTARLLVLADPDLRGFSRTTARTATAAGASSRWDEFRRAAVQTERLEEFRMMGEHARRAGTHLSNSNVALRETAAEAFFKTEAPAFRHLAFNTHGFLDDASPLYSTLLLKLAGPSDADDEDGLLYAYEVLSMRLDADEVWLGACRSGLGVERPGEGLFGMATAFLAAGARSTIGSVWLVNVRSGGLLMEEYYRAIGEGIEGAAALHRAKRVVRREFPDPSHWAPFLRVGR